MRVSKNKKPLIYFFIGTTAELIKLSPVIRELKRRKVDFKIISSNQNQLRFNELESIVDKHSPDYTFIMEPFLWLKDVYLRFIVWIIKSIANYYLYFKSEFKGKEKKVLFIVHGDTITALVGAVVAKLCRVKLVHVESGLRSFNFLEPFPEEFSRFVISHLADVHFCSNKWAVANLKRLHGTKINTFYNTIAESTDMALKAKKVKKIKALEKKKYFVFVIHRQEHTLFNKRDTERIIRQITSFANENLKCVFIMHHLTKDYLTKNQKLFSEINRNKNVILPARLDYVSFVHLVKNSEFIATDGGSNQEEAYYLGKPCLILRNHTERIEGLGENVALSKNDPKVIEEFINNYKHYEKRRPIIKVSPSKIIVDYLVNK